MEEKELSSKAAIYGYCSWFLFNYRPTLLPNWLSSLQCPTVLSPYIGIACTIEGVENAWNCFVDLEPMSRSLLCTYRKFVIMQNVCRSLKPVSWLLFIFRATFIMQLKLIQKWFGAVEHLWNMVAGNFQSTVRAYFSCFCFYFRLSIHFLLLWCVAHKWKGLFIGRIVRWGDIRMLGSYVSLLHLVIVGLNAAIVKACILYLFRFHDIVSFRIFSHNSPQRSAITNDNLAEQMANNTIRWRCFAFICLFVLHVYTRNSTLENEHESCLIVNCVFHF